MGYAVYMYKCRRCGEVYGSRAESDDIIANNILVNSIYGVDPSRSVPMYEVHRCSDSSLGGGLGVADLVGADFKED